MNGLLLQHAHADWQMRVDTKHHICFFQGQMVDGLLSAVVVCPDMMKVSLPRIRAALLSSSCCKSSLMTMLTIPHRDFQNRRSWCPLSTSWGHHFWVLLNNSMSSSAAFYVDYITPQNGKKLLMPYSCHEQHVRIPSCSFKGTCLNLQWERHGIVVVVQFGRSDHHKSHVVCCTTTSDYSVVVVSWLLHNTWGTDLV